MTPNLVEALKIYSLEGTQAFTRYLGSHSSPALVAMLCDLMTNYFGDKNSSTLRELVTTAVAGYERNTEKLGYNGCKTIAPGKVVQCEVKPKNVSPAAAGKTQTKLDGAGSFNDYTWARLEKDQKEAPNILVSGFVDGRLVYIFEFPFNSASFVDKLRGHLRKHLPDGDEEGRYVRGAGFSWGDYQSDARLVYRAPNMAEFREYITGGTREEPEGFYRLILETEVSGGGG